MKPLLLTLALCNLLVLAIGYYCGFRDARRACDPISRHAWMLMDQRFPEPLLMLNEDIPAGTILITDCGNSVVHNVLRGRP